MSLRSLVLFAFLAASGCHSDPAGGEPASPSDTGGETSARACGGIAGLPCSEDEFCDLGARCRMPDAMGTCAPRTHVCTREYRPVCGCDGRTYPTACVAHGEGASVLHEGPCEDEAAATGDAIGAEGQSCGSRGLAPCGEGLTCIHPQSAGCGETDQPGTCQRRPQACTLNYDPVCGCDGRTYPNACGAAAAGASVRAHGECP